MKKFIGDFILFLLFSMVVYMLAVFVWGTFAPNKYFNSNLTYPIGSRGHLFTRLQEVKTVNDIDVLFLGSSHAIRTFDTKAFEAEGYKAFNLGSKAGTPLQASTLLDRYLDQLNPKVVVYEVYPPTFQIDGVEASLHLLANDVVDKHAFALAFDQNHLKTYNALIYGLTRQLFGQNKSFKEPRIKHKDIYVPGGYVKRKGSWKKPREFRARIIKSDEKQLEKFEKILKQLKSRNIEVVLVFAPISPSLYSSFKNINDYDSLMLSYSNYYNFNKTMALKDKIHFFDSQHLNKKGVDKFTPKLVEILNSMAIERTSKQEMIEE